MTPSPLSRAVIENIFRTLRGRFGSEFVNRYRTGETVPRGLPNEGKDVGLLEAMDVWAHELRDLTPADIQHGLNCKFRRAPSSDEFVQACCTREFTPPAPHGGYDALPAPKLTREEAEVHIAEVRQTARRMRFPGENRLNLEWAYTIAGLVEAGLYRSAYCARMAAEAIRDSHKPVPPSLQRFLAKTNPMGDAA